MDNEANKSKMHKALDLIFQVDGACLLKLSHLTATIHFPSMFARKYTTNVLPR